MNDDVWLQFKETSSPTSRYVEQSIRTGIITNWIQILDFGAVRDGKPPEELGKRILLNEPEVRAMIEEEP